MDGLFVLLALAVLAIPVAVIVLIVGQSGLKTRVAKLERDLLTTRIALRDMTADAAATPPKKSAKGAATPQTAAEPETPKVAAEPETPKVAAVQATGDAVAKSPVPQRPAVPQKAKPAPANNAPIVMRSDRIAALFAWLRDNWVYAVSAVSLALAGIFLVQYGVEAGLLPPVVRVLMAIGLGAVLVVAGEWVRRRWGDGAKSSTAFLPSTLSGAGIVSMFAGVIAARQLYGLIGTEAAFAGLVLVAGLAIVLGWFYGPFLTAVGLIGAAIAPFAVGGSNSQYNGLYAFFPLIAFAGLAVDAVRRWAWVSVLALALGFGGVWLLSQSMGGAGWYAMALVVLALLAIAVPLKSLTPRHDGAMLTETILGRRKDWPGFPTRLAAGSVALAVAGLVLMRAEGSADTLLVFICLMALSLALTLWAEKAPALADLAVLPAAGFIARLALEAVDRGPLWADYMQGSIALRAPETSAPMMASMLLGLAVVITLAAAWRSFTDRAYPALWALGAAVVAPASGVVLEVLWTPREMIGAYPWALHAIGLAALMVVLAERFARVDGEDHRRMAYAMLSALAMIAFALFVVSTKGALTLALSVLIVVAAWMDRRFRLPEMALFIQTGVATLGWRLIFDPGLIWAMEAPMWEVAASFAGAIAAMGAARWLLTGMGRRGAEVVLISGMAGYGAIFANVLITRWITDTRGDSDLTDHWALTLNAMPWLVMMLVQLYRMQTSGWERILRIVLAVVSGGLALLILVPAVLLGNPMAFGGPVAGPLVLDTLALAYLMPGLLLLVSLRWLGHLPRWLRILLAVPGIFLTALYVVFEIRRFWQGDDLSVPGVTQPELYSYTVAMMLTGAGLLYQAIARRSQGLRRLAMAVIALTVVKVFLIDMSGLDGLLRVVSFLLVGLSLLGLAWLNRWAAMQQGGPDAPKGQGKA